MSGRILLVEADVVLGAVLIEVLWHSGYEVIFEKTLLNGGGKQTDSIDVVILDIDTTSPAKELAWLDAAHPFPNLLPVVLLGLETPQDLSRRQCMQSGNQQRSGLTSVQKPFRNEELVAAVREAHEGCWPEQANGT